MKSKNQIQNGVKVQIRIMATDLKVIDEAVEKLRKEFKVVYVSKAYKNRKQKGYRVYVTAYIL